jgi:hypothetical protein
MTNDATRCPYYISESQNVKSRWECVVPKNLTEKFYGRFDIPNNKADCEVYYTYYVWGKYFLLWIYVVIDFLR